MKMHDEAAEAQRLHQGAGETAGLGIEEEIWYKRYPGAIMMIIGGCLFLLCLLWTSPFSPNFGLHCRMRSTEPPILVVGAGFAGMAAAYECLKRGYDVIVLEEDEQLGGWWGKYGNQFSQLQRESASHHPDIDLPGKLGAYPTKAEIQAHLSSFVHAYGLVTRVMLGTKLTSVDTLNEPERYQVRYRKDGAEHTMVVQAVLVTCGPSRRLPSPTITGEQDFVGQVRCGLQDGATDICYASSKVAVLGRGCFAVEAALRALAGGAESVTMVGPTKTLVLPRVVMLLMDRLAGLASLRVVDVLSLCRPAYEFIGVDCEQILSVVDRTSDVSYLQCAGLPVSDLFFLALKSGRLRMVESTEAPCLSKHGVVLSAEEIVPADIVMRCDAAVGSTAPVADIGDDHHLNEALGLGPMGSISGFWVNSDPRICVLREPEKFLDDNDWPAPYSSLRHLYVPFFFYCMEHREDFSRMERILPNEGTSAYSREHFLETVNVLLKKADKRVVEEHDVLVRRARANTRAAHPWRPFIAEQRLEWYGFAAKLGMGAPPYLYDASTLEGLEERMSGAEGQST